MRPIVTPIAALGLLVIVTAACSDSAIITDRAVHGSGVRATETRSVSGFDSVVVIASGDVIITVDGTEALTIESDDNILPLLRTEVVDGRLELAPRESVSPTLGITYRISATSLTALEIRGSGDITADGVDSDRFTTTISGSGEVRVSGTTDAFVVEISGSGNVEGEALVARTGDLAISGSGSVVVNATDELTIEIGGAGSVEYLGSPRLTQSISGSGEVSQR